MLNQINKQDIHKITSGQVIVDLLSIVKELVENSIDAHSDVIEITFKEYGLESVEVNDNGDGINSRDFDSLCLKHYTSKLSKFEDLETVKTLGFRGEALSSICANGTLSIVTSVKGQLPYSNELDYDSMGNMIRNERVINRRTDKGTRVVVKDLFKSLPVRYKNFSKNIKREFHKMVQFLYTYIIINPGIKFNVNNVIGGKKKNVIITNKSDTILNNLIIIYGTKSIDSLYPFDLSISDNFKIQGYMSSISIGKGRALKDKQFLYLNKRPIINKEITKLINDTYNTFNNLQYPVFVLDLIVSDVIDVNVNPNKTIANLNLDLDVLRDRLMEYWGGENDRQSLNSDTLAVEREEKSVKLESDRTKTTGNPGALAVLGVSSRENLPTVAQISLKSPRRSSVKPKTFRGYDGFGTNNLKVRIRANSSMIQKVEWQQLSRFKEECCDEQENTVAKEITVKKLEFGEMDLIGQFNLGFLLTRLHNNLFIVDQHASDEKHNYETLKNTFKVKNQLLIKPIKLNLSLIEVNNLQNDETRHIIERNGFKLNDNHEITHLPIYKNSQFDETDLIELINEPKQIISKINKILAMKACRKSIMIGQHLSTPVMTRVLKNLSKLDKPWNCPHGRPTLRYLHNLSGDNHINEPFDLDYQL